MSRLVPARAFAAAGPLRRAIVLAACAVLAALAAPARAGAPYDFARTPGVLPKDIVPVEYVLHLVPHVAESRFEGRMTVSIDVRRPTAAIVMHALDLEIASARLERPGRAPLTLAAPRLDAERQTATFSLPTPLARGRHLLALRWRGKINVAAEGLFIDRFHGAGGEERVLLSTDLEPTGARRILPCWDEPSFRARFRVSLDLPAGREEAYSNMPVARRQGRAGGVRRIAFLPTPKMASYLLAFVVGDLERSSARVEGVELGVVATRGKSALAAYPLAASGELMRWFTAYFGVPYPLPKLDHLAIPGGFGGGMENWGAIIYNESNLLVDPEAGAESTRQRSFGIVAHEMAHQWFGDLVTMAWWDELWLNESFADWISYQAIDRLHPDWLVRLRNKGSIERAMALDARASTHPIQQPVTRDSEAEAAFDSISYDKGAGVLRMLEAYLGEAAFRDGVHAYLRRHRGSNTTSADLWTALAAASGKPVAAMADGWTTQAGFPLVDVDARCEAGRRIVTLRQQRFRMPDGSGAAPAVSDDPLWRIPVELNGLDGPRLRSVPPTVLATRDATAVIDDGCRGPLIVDRDDVGFFRVRYAPALFDALVARWAELPDSTRLKVLTDTSALMRADPLELARYVELLPGLRGEPRLAIWEQLLRDFTVFEALTDGEPARADFDRFARELLAPRFAELGWDERPGEPAEQRQLRARLAVALAHAGDPAAIAEGRARFRRFAAAPASVAPSMVEAVLDIAGRHADAATYDALLAIAQRAPTSDERFRAYRALSTAEDPALAARSVELAADSRVPQLMRHEMLAAVARNGHRRLAWDWARAHVEALLADMKPYDSGRFFTGIVDGTASVAFADELVAFARERLGEDALVEVRRGEDEIKTGAALKARLLAPLAAVFASR